MCSNVFLILKLNTEDQSTVPWAPRQVDKSKSIVHHCHPVTSGTVGEWDLTFPLVHHLCDDSR